MRILDVREKTVSIASPKMTTSVVAVVTDVIRDGRRVPSASGRRHRHRRELVLASGCAQPAALWRHAPRSRLPAIRLRALLRAGRVSAHARGAGGARLVEPARRAPWRAPDVAPHRRPAPAPRQRIITPRALAPRP